jgi:hypothetical protein
LGDKTKNVELGPNATSSVNQLAKMIENKACQRSLFFNKSKADYVTRRCNASSAGLIQFGSWTFAWAPLDAISRSNWSPEAAESEAALFGCAS